MIGSKKISVTAIAAVSAIALLAGCTSESAGPPSTGSEDFSWASVEPVELTVTSIFPPGNTASNNVLTEWMEAVTEGTEGKVSFDVYPSGTMHPATEGLSALTSGLSDITFLNNSYFPDQLPISNWDDYITRRALADFGYPNTNVAGMGAHVVSYGRDSTAAAEMREAGFIPILPFLTGPQAVHCADPFETPADLKGRQVRVSNETSKGEMESLGMTGAFIPDPEQYEALQRGVIDCAVNPATSLLSAGLLEVAPWMTFPNTAPVNAHWVVSTSAWDELDPEIQQVMLDARYRPLAEFTKTTLDKFGETVAAAEAAGGGVINPAKLNPTIENWWAAQPEPASVAPDGVADPEASVARIEKITAAWRNFTIESLGVPEGTADNGRDSLGLGSEVVTDWDRWIAALKENLGAQ
jgi:TRAP-type C4-dicarboxylate transport system substrate-binding protein